MTGEIWWDEDEEDWQIDPVEEPEPEQFADFDTEEDIREQLMWVEHWQTEPQWLHLFHSYRKWKLST